MKRILNVAMITVFGIFYGLSGVAFGYGDGDYSVHLNGGDDVAYIGEINTLEIWMANDVQLQEMTPAVEITFAIALSWEMAYGNVPPVNEEGRAIGRWDLQFIVTQDFDNISPDHLMLYGDALMNGLPAGPSELCYTLQFYIPPGEPETVDGISIVPYFYPPIGSWTFDDLVGYPPDFNGNPVADEYDPVAPPATFNIVRRIPCGDVDCSYTVNLSDAVYTINYIFKGGPPPCDGCE
jgi:hypothetical protein